MRDSLGCLRGTGRLRADQALVLKCRRCSCGGGTRSPSAAEAAHANIAEQTQKSSALSPVRLAESRVAAAVPDSACRTGAARRRSPNRRNALSCIAQSGFAMGAVPPHGCLTELGIDLMSSKGPVGQLVKLRGGCLPPRGRLTTGLQVGNLPHKSPKRLRPPPHRDLVYAPPMCLRPGGKTYYCVLSAALPHECVTRLRKAPARKPIAAEATTEPVGCRRANLCKPVNASPRS